MNRRQFLAALGVAAGAVHLNGLSMLEAEASLPLAFGDLFTIAGVYAVNPVTGQPTPFLRMFMVTAVTDGQVEFTPQHLGRQSVEASEVQPA